LYVDENRCKQLASLNEKRASVNEIPVNVRDPHPVGDYYRRGGVFRRYSGVVVDFA
jgi:hypothetical protein